MSTLDDVPEWSGMFLERDEVGYLEIADSDTRAHRVPAGWTLATIDECPEHSSQIFRYVKSDVTYAGSLAWMIDHHIAGLLVGVATGASIVAHPLIGGILRSRGLA